MSSATPTRRIRLAGLLAAVLGTVMVLTLLVSMNRQFKKPADDGDEGVSKIAVVKKEKPKTKDVVQPKPKPRKQPPRQAPAPLVGLAGRRGARRCQPSAGDDAVLAGTLGSVGRGIRTQNRLFERFAAVLGDDAGAEGDDKVAARHRRRGELPLKAGNRRRRFGKRGVGQQDDELFATKTAQDVRRPQGSAQTLDQMHQRLVAGLVTHGVVEALEVVKIDQGDGQFAAISTRAGQLALAGFVETTAVEGAGQGVGKCRLTGLSQLAFEFFDTRFGGQQLQHCRCRARHVGTTQARVLSASVGGRRHGVRLVK